MNELNIPSYISNCPISAGWIEYKGLKEFAMINYDESIRRGRAVIDIGYCATALLINGRVIRTVNYTPRYHKPISI